MGGMNRDHCALVLVPDFHRNENYRWPAPETAFAGVQSPAGPSRRDAASEQSMDAPATERGSAGVLSPKASG